MKLNKYGSILMVFLSLAATSYSYGQTDSLVFHNGNYLTGTVESMEQGILVFSTEYSDDDITVEWVKIKEIYTETRFLTNLSSGEEYLAKIHSSGPDSLYIKSAAWPEFKVSIHDVVYLDPMHDRFLDKLSASIDVGFNYTKAQNIRQLNVRSFLGYIGKQWSTDISFNSMHSGQDNIESTSTDNGTWNIRYNFSGRLYALATLNMLADSEQQLDLRANTQAGLGTYVHRSNRAYWTVKGGLNRNMERYYDSADDKASWEGFVGSELKIYSIGDLGLTLEGIIYPSITERGRWRTDTNLDFKYDLPMDFYISTGLTFNWDNQPAEGSDPTTLIFMAGFGWEW